MHLFIALTLASEGSIRKLASFVGHEVASLCKNKVLQIQNLPWSQSLGTGKTVTGWAGEFPIHHCQGTAQHSLLLPGLNPWSPDLCPFGTDGLSLSGIFLPETGKEKKYNDHHSPRFLFLLGWVSLTGTNSCFPKPKDITLFWDGQETTKKGTNTMRCNVLNSITVYN